MKDKTIKRLEEISDESDRFDERFESDELETNRDGLLDEIANWLRECAEHGCYVQPASPERRALRNILSIWSGRLQTLGRDVAAISLAGYDTDAGVPLIAPCPYPGLDPYGEDKGGIFFGRETQIVSLVAHIEDDNSRILLVVGASGSGKSSLALAGVLPRLKQKHGEEWLFPEPFTPGATPLRALAASLAAAIGAGTTADVMETRLSADPDAARDYLAGLCGGRPPMLLIDQFEELFTVCRSLEEQARFARVLVALSAPAPGAGAFRPRALLTLRTDYLARIESSASLKPLYARLIGDKNFDHVAALEAADIRRAIAEPARQIRLRFPDALIDRLATETAALPNGLPLLQFALRRLWDRRPGHDTGTPRDLVTEQMVNDLPTVKGALGKVADDIYAHFSAVQRKVCERLLKELIVLDEDFEEPLRRRRYQDEVLKVLREQTPGELQDVTHVIDAFAHAHLIRRFGKGENTQLEVAHEALLRHWDVFSRILDEQEFKEQINLVKQVGREAAEWIARGRSESYLNLKGERLQRARQHAREGWLEEAESAQYVAESARRQQRAKIGNIVIATVLLLLVAALVGGGWLKSRADTEALRRQTEADAKALRLQTEADAQAVRLEAQSETLAAKRTAVTANLTAYSSIARTLPPWDDLDVAYTLAHEFGAPFRYALARALERMEDTTLVGDTRSLPLLPNDDGSAFMQFHRASENEHTLRVFLLSSAHEVLNTPVTIDLGGRFQRLATVKVGPAVGAEGEHLALLVFSGGDAGSGFEVELYRLSPSARGQNMKPVHRQVLRDAIEVTGVGFHPRQLRAVVVALVQPGKTASHVQSRVVDLGFDADGGVSAREAPMPAGGVPVSAVAFMGEELVLGHVDGSVTCPGGAYIDTSREPSARRSPIGQLAVLPGGALLAALSRDTIYALDCQGRRRIPVGPANEVRSITLVNSAHNGGSAPLLSYIAGFRHRCFHPNQDNEWTEYACNSQRRIAYAIPLPVTVARRMQPFQLTIEDPKVAAIHRHPMEADEQHRAALAGLWSKTTTARWRLPGATSGRPGTSSPAGPTAWSVRGPGEIEAADPSTTILQVAMSHDGRRLAWVEWKTPADGGRPALYLLTSAVDTLNRPSDGQVIDVRPSALAISGDGTIALAWPPRPSADDPTRIDPAALVVDGDTLPLVNDERKPLSCLAFSPDGTRLLAGTPGGSIKTWRRPAARPGSGWKQDAEGWVSPFAELDARGNTAAEETTQQITACDVADNGELAVGGAEGNVARVPPGAPPQHLTQRVAFRVPARIKDIAIDQSLGRQHILALGDWQASDCGRPALAGQALSVWDTATLADDDSLSPVASVCFPNEPVLALAGMVPGADSTSAHVRLLTATGERLHQCFGCAIGDENAAAMLERLLSTAVEREKAEPLSQDLLYRRYGLRY